MTVTRGSTVSELEREALQPILFVEDVEDDFVIARHQIKKLRVRNPVATVDSLAGMIDYLDKRGGRARSAGPLPAAIIMDLRLRGENGLDGQARLRTNLKYRRIPIIVISSNDRLHSLRAAAAIGANGFLVKPFKAGDFMTLAAKLKLPLDFDAV
jgi:two-component system response regulator